jgi:hypothetical protein
MISPHGQLSLDLEVYADQHAEMLEELVDEHRQVLEDASEEEAFNTWADDQAERLELEEEDDRHRDQPEHPANILKLDWPIVRGGITPDGAA